MMTNRRKAQMLYNVACWLTRIKTPMRFHEFEGFDEETHKLIETKPPTWGWGSCQLSMVLLDRSMQLDWDHWSHWATVEGENEIPCTECGGHYDPEAERYFLNADSE